MPLTLLFDLDDTLLETNLESFVPAYFQALTQHLERHIMPTATLRALIQSMSLMNESADPTRVLQEIFDANFYGRLGMQKEELAEDLEIFYDEVFPSLRSYTRQKPAALPLINWAMANGFRVAIATDPLFPRKATHHRLRWAGFEPDQFDLVSTYENFHFSKTHPAYYAELLGQLGWNEGPVLMVGNDAQRDILTARRLGLKSYFVDDEAGSRPGAEAKRGRLEDLRPWLESIDLSILEPSFKSPDAILGVMLSTPAVLKSISCELSEEQWHHEPTRNDWALNELVCHLRDTEREIHKMQLELMLQREDSFIPRPDTSVWANEREYLHEDGIKSLREFAVARLDNLEKVRNLGDEIWVRRVRHAIFGPTNFLEVMGFMADHDRMHIQQAWATLKSPTF